jgi:hypothetical protein
MKAFLINPAHKQIEPIDLQKTEEDIALIVGQKDIGFDDLGNSANRLYFDEACFIHETPESGRFKVDSLPPVAGKAVVVGWNADTNSLADTGLSLDALRVRVSFL